MLQAGWDWAKIEPLVMGKKLQFPCPYCNKFFTTRGDMKRHTINLHMAPHQNKHSCWCGKSYKYMRDYHRHRRQSGHRAGPSAAQAAAHVTDQKPPLSQARQHSTHTQQSSHAAQTGAMAGHMKTLQSVAPSVRHAPSQLPIHLSFPAPAGVFINQTPPDMSMAPPANYLGLAPPRSVLEQAVWRQQFPSHNNTSTASAVKQNVDDHRGIMS